MARGFLAVSCFWQGSTERSRPFPTNQPKGCKGCIRSNKVFRQPGGRIYASRAVYALYRIVGTAAAGGIVAVPTSQPILFIIVYGRGRGVPRPYQPIKTKSKALELPRYYKGVKCACIVHSAQISCHKICSFYKLQNTLLTFSVIGCILWLSIGYNIINQLSLSAFHR